MLRMENFTCSDGQKICIACEGVKKSKNYDFHTHMHLHYTMITLIRKHAAHFFQ